MTADRLDSTHSYFVSSLRVRRELIPVPDQPDVVRCLTYRADHPQEGDIVIADQVAFDNLLIEFGLAKPRDFLKETFASVWRGLNMDKLMPSTRPPVGEHMETLLKYVK